MRMNQALNKHQFTLKEGITGISSRTKSFNKLT